MNCDMFYFVLFELLSNLCNLKIIFCEYNLSTVFVLKFVVKNFINSLTKKIILKIDLNV